MWLVFIVNSFFSQFHIISISLFAKNEKNLFVEYHDSELNMFFFLFTINRRSETIYNSQFNKQVDLLGGGMIEGIENLLGPSTAGNVGYYDRYFQTLWTAILLEREAEISYNTATRRRSTRSFGKKKATLIELGWKILTWHIHQQLSIVWIIQIIFIRKNFFTYPIRFIFDEC